MALLIPATYPEPAMVVQMAGDPPPTPPTIGRVVHPANGREFSLQELYAHVGEPIDISNLPDGRMMVINDNGKVDRLPVNVEATEIYRNAWKGHSDWASKDTVVGDVLLCEPGEIT